MQAAAHTRSTHTRTPFFFHTHTNPHRRQLLPEATPFWVAFVFGNFFWKMLFWFSPLIASSRVSVTSACPAHGTPPARDEYYCCGTTRKNLAKHFGSKSFFWFSLPGPSATIMRQMTAEGKARAGGEGAWLLRKTLLPQCGACLWLFGWLATPPCLD